MLFLHRKKDNLNSILDLLLVRIKVLRKMLYLIFITFFNYRLLLFRKGLGRFSMDLYLRHIITELMKLQIKTD